MKNSIDPIPALPEASACGQMAVLFADIKKTLNVPFVNLVWRHLATIPEALPSVWTLVKPLYSSQSFNTAADGLCRLEALQTLIRPVPEYVFQTCALSASDLREVREMLSNYNHANARALLALSMAGQVLTTYIQTTAVRDADHDISTINTEYIKQEKSSSSEAERVTTRRLPDLNELSAPIRLMIDALNGFGFTGQTQIVASLYRHLAYWPAFLAIAWSTLKPLDRDGTLTQEASDTRQKARQWASANLSQLPSACALSAVDAQRALNGIEDFTNHAICRMVVMGVAMKVLVSDTNK